MVKTNLPVILLRGIVLLPNNEIRLEFENDDSRNIIDVAELFHDNKLLVVSSANPLEEIPDRQDLSRIGVISKITHKIELPNGKVRVVIRGMMRAEICEYLNLENTNETLESIVANLPNEELDKEEEHVRIRKLYRELEDYIKMIPYMSNSVLSQIVNVTELGKVTDIIVPHMPLSLDRMHEYLKETSATKRMEMILEDIYHEKEMFEIEKRVDNKVRNEMEHAQKEYLLREKIKFMKEELGDINAKGDETDLLRKKIDELEAPDKIKDRLYTELRKYDGMNPSSPEMNIIHNYIHWLLDLPWTTSSVDNEDLKDVARKLDESHYGLDKVKTRIIEYLAVKQMTKSLNGPIICLVGPPGVGKTSLAISIARAMNRKFVKMSVGGVNDEAEIMGHRRTYIGASPGRIIQAMKKAGTINPVFLIDEIDKMTKDIKGDPASALLEILDPEQNKYFSDHYIEEEYDLSNVLFIATANYLEDIPEPLKDRLEIVMLSGYTEYEKLDIAKRHLLPDICKKHGIATNLIHMNDEVILKVIREYTKEAGVRELERQLSTIVRKIVTKIVLKETINFEITGKTLNHYLGKAKFRKNTQLESKVGVVNGLAYTSYGGDTLPIEVNYFKGHGNLYLTGSLGDVMKESAHIALSYIKANASLFHIDYQKLVENDIHIHVPEGAIPKDGPSAGIALTTALVSAFTNQKVDKRVAMTGEITLRGNVLPIGGLKEKSLGAYRNGIKTIIIPYENMRDLNEIPKEIKEEIRYIPVHHYKDVYKHLYH